MFCDLILCYIKIKMYPPIWGPHVWKFLHILALSYPINPSSKEQDSMIKFLNLLCIILPCPMCSEHCSTYIENNKPNVKNRDSFKKWLFDFHNDVNYNTNKKILTYAEAEKCVLDSVIESYNKSGNNIIDTPRHNFVNMYIYIMITIIILSIFVFYKLLTKKHRNFKR